MAFYVTDKDGNEQLIAGAGRVGPRGLPGPPGPKGDTGDDGNPIGTVISFLGLTAPDGYLVCDGATYSIADYQALSAFIASQFGSANHFGGDGTATFAVPDMRNLFLRGYHGTAEEQLSGDIGARQEGTEHSNVYSNRQSETRGEFCAITSSTFPSGVPNSNQDKTTGASAAVLLSAVNVTTIQEQIGSRFTSRPVNAAVLYCIKAVKTVSSAPPPTAAGVSYDSASSGLEAETVQAAIDEVADKLAAGEVYSTEEVRIGTWLGKPLYRRMFSGTFEQTGIVRNSVFVATIDNISIVTAMGNMYSHINDVFYTLPYVEFDGNSTTFSVSVLYYNNDIILNSYIFSGQFDFSLIVEYTKTTDTAGDVNVVSVVRNREKE